MAQTNKSKNMLQAYYYNEDGDKFNIHSRQLSDDYVYYEQLLNYPSNDIRYKAGRMVEASMNALKDNSAAIDTVLADRLAGLAQNELQKEVEFLNKNFHSNLDPKTVTDKMLVEAINKSLALKGQFERNVARIKAGETRITPTKFFDSYFKTRWNNAIPQILNSINIGDTADKIATIIETQLRDVIRDSLQALLNSKTWPGKQEDARVYQALLAAIDGNSPSGNKLLEDLYDAYNLNDIHEKLVNILQQNSNRETQEATLNKIGSRVKTAHRTSSGVLYESVEAESLSLLADSLNNLKIGNGLINFDVHVAHTGGTKMKADNVMSFGFDLSELYETLRDVEKDDSVREYNIKVIQEFQERLAKESKTGTIVYINDKDYTLSSNFKGFSAGVQSLGNFEATMKGYVSRDIIGTIRQTLTGAIGHGQKSQIEHILAADVARWLFDDFKTIGDVPLSDVSSIHLMSLDGIYFPLSVFLSRLSQAFGTVDEGNLVAVHIEKRNILWSSTPAGGWQPGMWQTQRDNARDLNIEVKFMAGFQQLIDELG